MELPLSGTGEIPIADHVDKPTLPT